MKFECRNRAVSIGTVEAVVALIRQWVCFGIRSNCGVRRPAKLSLQVWFKLVLWLKRMMVGLNEQKNRREKYFQIIRKNAVLLHCFTICFLWFLHICMFTNERRIMSRLCPSLLAFIILSRAWFFSHLTDLNPIWRNGFVWPRKAAIFILSQNILSRLFPSATYSIA